MDDAIVIAAGFRIAPILFAEFFERVHDGRSRSDGIPGGYGGTRINTAQSRGCIAVYQNFIVVSGHRLQMKWQWAREFFLGVIVTDFQRLQIRIAQSLLAGETFIEQRFNSVHVDFKRSDESTGVGDVLHQRACARVFKPFVADLRKRDGHEVHVIAIKAFIERPGRIVKNVAALAHFFDIARVGLRVHGNHQVVVEGARRVSFIIDADFIPGGQPLNVRREQDSCPIRECPCGKWPASTSRLRWRNRFRLHLPA